MAAAEAIREAVLRLLRRARSTRSTWSWRRPGSRASSGRTSPASATWTSRRSWGTWPTWCARPAGRTPRGRRWPGAPEVAEHRRFQGRRRCGPVNSGQPARFPSAARSQAARPAPHQRGRRPASSRAGNGPAPGHDGPTRRSRCVRRSSCPRPALRSSRLPPRPSRPPRPHSPGRPRPPLLRPRRPSSGRGCRTRWGGRWGWACTPTGACSRPRGSASASAGCPSTCAALSGTPARRALRTCLSWPTVRGRGPASG